MNICPNASGCFLPNMDWIGSTMGSKSLARPRNFKLLLCPNNHQHDILEADPKNMCAESDVSN